MNTENYHQHVTILGWIHIAFGILFTLCGAGILLFFAGIGAASGEPEAMAVLSVIGAVSSAFLLLVGIPGLLAGYGLLQRKGWGRILAIVISVLDLFNFPVGTLVGGYGLWVLTAEPSTAYFGSAPLTA